MAKERVRIKQIIVEAPDVDNDWFVANTVGNKFYEKYFEAINNKNITLSDLHMYKSFAEKAWSDMGVNGTVTVVPNQKQSENENDPVNCDIIIKKGRPISFKIGTEISTKSGIYPSGSMLLRFRNAESFKVNVNGGDFFGGQIEDMKGIMNNVANNRDYEIEYSRPLPDFNFPFPSYGRIIAGICVENREWTKSNFFASYKGATLAYETGNHLIRYKGFFRNAMSNDKASQGIRFNSGVSFESSIFYQYFVDSRTSGDPFSTGSKSSASVELAGIGGDVRYLKPKIDTQFYFKFLNNWVFNVNAAVGILVPFGGYRPTIPDKYFEKIRGFFIDGIGPMTQNSEALGSRFFFSNSFHLISPMLDKDVPIRFHGFLNFANMSDASDGMRVTTGFGIIIPLGGPQLEINFNHPIRTLNGDKPYHNWFSAFIRI